MAKMFIDAGHGGKDFGASGDKSKEKDNCLNIALAVGENLKDKGHAIKCTRTTDDFVSLTGRANSANDWDADLFISVHNNSATNTSDSGFESFIYNGSVSQNTKDFQSAIHNSIAEGIDIPDRGKKSGNLEVVRLTKMPAMLIEYGFITNAKDENILINNVDKLATLTANGVADYLGSEDVSNESTHKSKTKPVKTSNNIDVDGKWGKTTTRALQKALGTPVDGIISLQPSNSVSLSLYDNTVSFGSGGSPLIEALQLKVGASVDRKLGPATVWALQKYLGAPVDGVLGRPGKVVKEMQRRLNASTF